jgi:hypothetical protein
MLSSSEQSPSDAGPNAVGRLEFSRTENFATQSRSSRHRNLCLTSASYRTESELILWTMPPNYNAQYLQHLPPFSVGKNSRDTGDSNPPCSASQSPFLGFSDRLPNRQHSYYYPAIPIGGIAREGMP